MKEGKYNIKAICTILGIQPGTLRAWERRYHIISPVRNEAGHRLYTDEHVKILKWLVEKIQEGFTIGQAVVLLESNEYVQIDVEKDNTTLFVNQLTNALLDFDEEKATNYVNEAFSLFSVDKVMSDIFAAVLAKVAKMTEAGLVTIAHRHFVTTYLQMRIGMIYQHLPINPTLPKVIAVSGPNEDYELELFLFTIFLRRKGFQVIYLGVGIPDKDLKMVIDQLNPALLFISCFYLENRKATYEMADKFEQMYPSLLVGLGGGAFVKNASEAGERYVGDKREEWEKWIYSNLSKFS
ncbi:MAG: MerR family transcriptional regulator [Bacillaceae bacterium]